MSTDIPYLPVAEIKEIPQQKKKKSWWKRLFVFAVGILQICVGAMIIATTAGAAHAFGAHMITQGLRDTLTAIFNPEACENLRAFYTNHAIGYAMSLASIGLDGINQLATTGLRLGPNQSIMGCITQGLRGGISTENFMRSQIFSGIASEILSQGANRQNNNNVQSNENNNSHNNVDSEQSKL